MDLTEKSFPVYNALHDCGASTEAIAAHFGGALWSTTLSTACSSAANAILCGANLIRCGLASRVAVGGSEALSSFHLNGFNSLMIVDREPCRPFDKSRAGLNLGEGAAFLILESEESLRGRGGKALARLSGFGNACDAYHQTASSPTGEGAFLAMRKALSTAGLRPEDIDYVNAHGTGTPDNDAAESAALRRVFGEALPPVSSTKAFTGQVTVLTMIALAMGEARGTIDRDEYLKVVKGLNEIPDKIREVLQTNDRVADLARTFTYAHNFLYLGRGYSYPVALEGALKLKEISYIHAEGYPAAEMKHGPIALIDSDMPVVVIATHDAMYEKVLSNIQEIKARKGRVIALVTKGDDTIAKIADEVIELPDVLECLEPLVATIPLQLLSYHVAVCKGKNVDQPRNLAKSVTVE